MNDTTQNNLRKLLGEEEHAADFTVCHNEQDVKRHMSMFGNEFVTITEKEIEQLKAGMILSYMINDEYGFFITFKKGKDNVYQ